MSAPKMFTYPNGYQVEEALVTPLNLCACFIGNRECVAGVLGLTKNQWTARLRDCDFEPVFTEQEAMLLSLASGVEQHMFRPPKQKSLL